MPLTTLLFDLDGTLLPLHLNRFLQGYFRALLPNIAHLGAVDTLQQAIVDATEATICNEDPNITNMEVFQHEFRARTDINMEDIWPIFDAFYEKQFTSLRPLTEPTYISREICRTASEKGYQLVIATNPIFPGAAIRHRMDWAGLSDVPFRLVTTMEDMHFCKPNPKYFIEIMDKLDVSPRECLMFGNDVQEDGVAGNVGMDTYLVTDWMIDRHIGHLEFTHRGTLADVLRFVENLPRA